MTRPLRRLARPVAVLALAGAFAGSLGGLATAGGAPGVPDGAAPRAELGPQHAQLAAPEHAQLAAPERCARPRAAQA